MGRETAPMQRRARGKPVMAPMGRGAAKRPEAVERRRAIDISPSFARVVAAFAHDRRVSQQRMFSSDTVLSVNGKIFAMIARGKFVAKLPKARVDALVSGRIGERFDPGHGRLMKEWVAVGPGKVDWVELAREAHRFVTRGARAPSGGARQEPIRRSTTIAANRSPR